MSKILTPLLFGALLALAGQPLSASAQCRDPWIAKAYQQVARRNPVGQGEICECNIKLYNNGSWGNYNELVGYVQQFLNSGTRVGYAPLSNGNFAMAILSGNQVSAVSVLNAGGNVVAAGGGNVVAAGGGNVVAAGGGNLVAAGGGNITGLSNSTPGFAFGMSRGLLAAGEQRKPTSGNGAIVIK
ncbi:hypothetical protein [Hymenobacter properus]|uniref:Uncharacterized protein n=1 Tax=Hymenobacter properus TaxID=2791026 RepID=A0A931FJ35_9BACT|nr:hypothetical protein [Hymenobacter properus]MBF9141448.1 hypothetical protein [Hymenobacter properus]MBR7720257.1 hypothetical protein [Microvirga sp. SRT04]